ncbi:MAG TPA: SGNH/GDSL hydrolase family protein [Vicinamibacteria bacterium]|nr:SGNH/GDSL hydrolase family protein [Vicinamibacteria bacterium]
MSLLGKRGELALLLASGALFLLMAEVGVRLLGSDRPRPTGYAPLNTNRRAMRPQNLRGYRDLERTIPKPPGVRRIVSLGDSFAWGASVEFEDAYPQRLERGLSRRRQEPWEVVNLALPGMNTVDQAAQLADEGLAYQPEAVVLGYVLNDSEDAAAAETRRAEDWLAARRAPPGGVFNRSALFRLVQGRLWATAENRRRVNGYRSMFAETAPGWIASQQALKTLGARCRERGVPLLLAVFPLFGNPLDESYPFSEIHSRVAAAGAAAGAKVVDLLPAYRGLKWEILVVDGVDDEHPNEIAHRIAANRLLKELDQVLPWSGESVRQDDAAKPSAVAQPARPPHP